MKSDFEYYVKNNNIKKIANIISSCDYYSLGEILSYTAKYQKNEIFDLLINFKSVNLTYGNCAAFRFSCINGNEYIFNKLIKFNEIDPTLSDQFTLVVCCEKNRFEFVKKIIENKNIDPSFNQNVAIRLAKLNSSSDIIKILWKDNRVKKSLLKDDFILYDKLTKEDIINKMENF